MVTKSKLKMALLAEKGVDFKKLKQKKLAKKARKEFKSTKPTDEWEDVEESKDGKDGGVELEGEDSEDDRPAQIDLAGMDDSDSDSDSSSGVEDSHGQKDADEAEAAEEEDEEEDEEDIPISDLEDLEDEDKEDIIPHQRLTINNTIALTSTLERIALPLSTFAFSEHQSLTTSAPVSIPDVSDDLNRELAFYAQSLSAVKEARALLKAEGAPFSRPKDYFAEMVKADEHMTKIKAKLVEEAASKKAAAEARKQRDLKKFGKQVQVAKLQEREKERKQTMEKIKVLKRKRQDGSAPTTATEEADLFDVALDDTVSKPDSRRDLRRERGVSNNKRQKKNEKFGYGGKKRFSKSGDAFSSGDLTGFSTRKMKGKAGGGGAAAKRPGKARRAGARR